PASTTTVRTHRLTSTTLSRSRLAALAQDGVGFLHQKRADPLALPARQHRQRRQRNRRHPARKKAREGDMANDLAAVDGSEIVGRSEEHTSELQSRQNLVCRLP